MLPCGQTMKSRFGAVAGTVLTEGASPRKLALTIALGVMIGILPLAWGTTLLCAVLAYFLKLNQAGIQAVNYLAFPLQIALFVPFYRLGARMFPLGPSAFAEGIAQLFGNDWVREISLLLAATLKALAAWFFVAGPAAALLYLFVLPIVARMLPAGNNNSGEGTTLQGDLS